ncbi:MAG: hypothetical protein K2W96_02820 [Gemmataceae bacterium]|nr:hypothetical protein [Gemmataceae bacterium]
MLGLLLLVLLVGAGVGFRFLPWQWKLGVLGAGALLLWLFMIPFKLKGGALAWASATVHGLEPADAPPPDPEAPPEEGSPRRWFVLDATIKPPLFSLSPFRLWEPGELALIGPGESLLGDKPADACVIASRTSAFLDGSPDEDGYKVSGPRRMRFVIGVRPGVERLRFQDYFKKFDRVAIPAEAQGEARRS